VVAKRKVQASSEPIRTVRRNTKKFFYDGKSTSKNKRKSQ
jgi:hypothetical protein